MTDSTENTLMHVASISHKHGDDLYHGTSKQLLTDNLAEYCCEWWRECFPNGRDLPNDNEDIVSEYFEQSMCNTSAEYITYFPHIDIGELINSNITSKLLKALKRAEGLLTELRAHELDDKEDIETMNMIQTVIGQAEGYRPDADDICTACKRQSIDCSRNPCPAVIKDRQS